MEGVAMDKDNEVVVRPLRGAPEIDRAYGAIDYEFQAFLRTGVLFLQVPDENQFENSLMHARLIIQFLGPLTSKTSVDDIKPIDFGVDGDFWGEHAQWFRRISGIIDKHLAHLTWARAGTGNGKPQGLLIVELLENLYPKMVAFAEALENCRPERRGTLRTMLEALSPAQTIGEVRQ